MFDDPLGARSPSTFARTRPQVILRVHPALLPDASPRVEGGVARALRAARAAVAMVALLAVVVAPRLGHAQGAAVPAQVQAELLSKLASYDRNFATRAGTKVRVLVVVKAKDPRSKLFAASLRGALGNVAQIGGLPHEESLVAYESAALLAERCRGERAAVVYLTPGFESEVSAIRSSLRGVDVLSVSAVPEHVPDGVVIGFELVSGRPKILVNLPQAKDQNVSFSADVLKLMKVYR